MTILLVKQKILLFNLLLLKQTPELALLSNYFITTPFLKISDTEHLIQNKYCDIDELQQLKIHNKEKSPSICINFCSLNENFEEIEDLYTTSNK